MSAKILKPKQTLNKASLIVKPNRNKIKDFKSNLTKLIDHSNEIKSEEFHKNLEVKHLIVTDINEWFNIYAQPYERHFAAINALINP